MDMTGERRIAAPRQTVWQALNDPAVLKASIPGCESLEKLSDTDMKATAAVKLGPISARFSGDGAPVRHRSAERLHDQRRGPGRRRRLRQRRRQGAPGGRRRRHPAALRGQRPGGRQAGPARRAADRRHRQADGRSFFDRFSAQVAPPAPVAVRARGTGAPAPAAAKQAKCPHPSVSSRSYRANRSDCRSSPGSVERSTCSCWS